MTAKQVNNQNQARNTTSTSNLTQASSISTKEAGNSTITAKQAPNDINDWLSKLIGNKTPSGNSGYQNASPQKTAVPQPSANPNQSVNPPQAANSSSYEQQVLNLVNQERTKAGLKPLSLNTNLSKVAMAKAQDMIDNNYFDHNSPTYGSPFEMMKAFGITYNTAGENIAKGQKSAEEVMNQWMNSPGHRANILNSSFTDIGIGYYNSGWVQQFIG